MDTNKAGIDYGSGLTNIDHKTGIRYGIISQHTVMPEALDDLEYVYPEPDESLSDKEKEQFDESAECIGLQYNKDGYFITACLDSDLMITRSDYYTFCIFCSPCVPGAGDLDSPNPAGIKAYCLGHDWFEGNKAPYPVFSVETDKEIKAK